MVTSLDPLCIFECLIVTITSIVLLWKSSVDSPQRVPNLVGSLGMMWCLSRLSRGACHVAIVANHDATFQDPLKKDAW